ncbi:MAG: 50S ribosomal protein L7/L12 [Candidatus Harrisonbacteria bacterium]|nr:50S ribosomal protein L7/L12 [Candidatus Harrisonbacteria bacterium]
MEKYNDLLTKIGEMKVTELAELVKAMEEKFGVSAAMPVMAAGGAAAGGGEAAEEKTAWNVLLKEGGGQKIQVIKVLREVTGLGLKEAKDLVDAAPKVVKEGLKKEEAEDLKKKLEGAGATAELQ